MNSFGRKIALEIGVVLFSFVLYVDLSWAAKFAIVSDVGKVENFMSRKRAGSISAVGAELSRPWIAANLYRLVRVSGLGVLCFCVQRLSLR